MAMTTKQQMIAAYFDEWDRDIGRAQTLLESGTYFLEALLVLSCYIGAFAAARYPGTPDNQSYNKVVAEYSGMADFYRQLDLLFFYQWPRSKLKSHGAYRKLRNHKEISEFLQKKYGTEQALKNRYVAEQEAVKYVAGMPTGVIDQRNFQENLHLFSLLELLYMYLRCDAVHNADFPFINKAQDRNGKAVYEENHLITGKIVLDTVKGIARNLREVCLAKECLPHELG